MYRFTPVLPLIFLVGCALHVGPFDAALFGSYYTHREVPYGDHGADGGIDAPETPICAVNHWQTAIGRTWGTVDIEATIDEKSEKVASTGKGMSDNMAGVLGEDLGKAIAFDVVCALQPINPRCLGDSE